MASPLPLTQTPAATLDWSRPGTPAASDFGDIYFSTDGGLEETRAVFLEGCGLPGGWREADVFTIAELGFGSGLNFLASWQAWRQSAQPHQRLHFVSFEKFPFDKTQLQHALSAWPELAQFSSQLVENWPGRVKGIHRLHFGPVTLTLFHDDVLSGLAQADNLKANAWFLDGFSPSANPAMWSGDVMRAIAASSAAGARIATFSVAGSVRTALSGAGFTVRKMPGFGRKRHRLEAECLEAELTGLGTPQTPPIETALIVGAGIAGRSIAQALSIRGIPFEIIDDRSRPAASGNPAALVKPRFDLQDRPESRFFLSAYLYALRTYPEDAILARGVRQIPKTAKEAERFAKLAAQALLGEGQLKWDGNALWIEDALVIDPSLVFQNFDVQRQTYDPARDPEKYAAKYSHVFLAAGYGMKHLTPELSLRFSRGQLSWAEPVWDTPTAYGGYAVNMDGAALVGATHDRLDSRDPFEIRPEDDAKNLAALANISGRDITPVHRPSRASVRVTSRDTLPVIANLGGAELGDANLGDANLGDNIWALSGLGSRGFSFAPLLAEALVSKLCGEVSPIDMQLSAKFSDLSRLS